MQEHFQWDDIDGNNGYYFGGFTPAELQAVWELAPALIFFDAFGTRTNRSIRIALNYEGVPCMEGVPVEEDAKKIKDLIQFRAGQIEASGKISPPTIDEIREKLSS